MRIFNSTTFQFCLIILVVTGIATAATDDMTWKDWLDAAVYFVGIYATKEGVRYGSQAYKDRPNA